MSGLEDIRTTVGRSTISIPKLCFGTTSLADMPKTYGYSVDEERALATVRAIFDSPFPFLDTSRNYGLGRSEERIGKVIAERGGLPARVILSTKLDRDMDTLRFDGARARRSLEESLEALNLDRIPILHLHDPEHAADLSDITRPDGAIAELFKMKEEGLAGAVGLAAGVVDIMMPLLRDYDFDVLITHNRHTVVSANAEPMIAFAQERGITVLNAAPYAGGALAKGSGSFRRYVYQEATDEMLAPVRAVEAICERHGVPPGAVALQFSLRDPRIASTICGVSKPERMAETIAWANHPIPEALWTELATVERSTIDPESTRQYDPG
jgi:D-threo-aldose 1-dehydrogenase